MVDIVIPETYASLTPWGLIVGGFLLLTAVFVLFRGERTKKKNIIGGTLGAAAVGVVIAAMNFGWSWYSLTPEVERDIISAVGEKNEYASYMGADTFSEGQRYIYVTSDGKMAICAFHLDSITNQRINVVTSPAGERTFPVEVKCDEQQ